MKTLMTSILALLITCGTHLVFADTPAKSDKPIQNSAQATQYFEEELHYTTNPHGVKAVLDGTVKNVTIVDVRAAKDYAAGHIPGAINIPLEKHNGFKGNETEFAGLRKDGYNYIYCYDMLCNLSQYASKKFASLGYPVKEIKGGFKSWQDAGHPIEK